MNYKTSEHGLSLLAVHLLQIKTMHIYVSGLKTNVQKSSIIPIRCQGVNLDEVLPNFPAKRARVWIFDVNYTDVT
jgi:hypothetical protein